MTALLRQKAHTFMKNTGVIFSNPEGEPWPNEKRQRQRFFQPALKACGIRTRDACNTRHTFATTALMAGINPNDIASQLDHTTIAMLFQRYAKWIPDGDDGRAAKHMNAAFGESRELAPNWSLERENDACLGEKWSERRDLNPRPPVPQTGALTRLRHAPIPVF